MNELKSTALFNDIVVMDLVFYDGERILHLMDTVSRFSSTCFSQSNSLDEVVRKSSETWLSIFGTPKQFLISNVQNLDINLFHLVWHALNLVMKAVG